MHSNDEFSAIKVRKAVWSLYDCRQNLRSDLSMVAWGGRSLGSQAKRDEPCHAGLPTHCPGCDCSGRRLGWLSPAIAHDGESAGFLWTLTSSEMRAEAAAGNASEEPAQSHDEGDAS